MEEWTAFEYREFYDYPRALLVEHEGVRYLLDCRFDDLADEYPSEYQICRLADDDLPIVSWHELGDGAQSLGSLTISPQLFDSTRRKKIRWDLIRAAIESRSQ